MLRINVPFVEAEQLYFSDPELTKLPLVPDVVETATDKNAVLLFGDEKDAVTFADSVEEIATTVRNGTPRKDVMRDLVSAIRNDESVRTYLE